MRRHGPLVGLLPSLKLQFTELLYVVQLPSSFVSLQAEVAERVIGGSAVCKPSGAKV